MFCQLPIIFRNILPFPGISFHHIVLICFLALMIYRFLEKKLDSKYTCEELLKVLKSMNFAEIQEQGFMPLYKREKITDDLHAVYGFRTDYQFITKSKMKTIQKNSKDRIVPYSEKGYNIECIFCLYTSHSSWQSYGSCSTCS